MICECPIASSSVGAIPEMLDIFDNPCGLCFKPRSVDEIERAICSLVFEEDTKSMLAKKAKHRVCENYMMHIVWKKLVEIWIS
jgi:glycosyltransferase involved in cell wall biosynthesis